MRLPPIGMTVLRRAAECGAPIAAMRVRVRPAGESVVSIEFGHVCDLYVPLVCGECGFKWTFVCVPDEG